MNRLLTTAVLCLAAACSGGADPSPAVYAPAPEPPCDRPAWEGLDKDPLDLLARHLLRGSSRARHFAAARLAEGGRAAVTALESLRADSGSSPSGRLVDANICDALALMDPNPQSLALLRDLVRSPIGLVQIKASRALAVQGVPGDAALLAEVLESADGTHRRALMGALALAGNPAAPALERILARPADQDLHAEALLLLAGLEVGRDSKTVLDHVGGLDLLSVRVTSILAGAGHPRAVEWLTMHAQDAAPEVRTAAALGLYGRGDVWDDVARSKETTVKRACLAAWPEGDPAPEVLRSYLYDPDPGFRREAMKAFAMHGDPEFMESLLERLRAPGLTPRTLNDLVALLADPQVKETRALDVLEKMASRPGFRNQLTVWQALSSLGGGRAAQAFADAIMEPGLVVSGRAANEVLPALAVGVGEDGVAVYLAAASGTDDSALRALLLASAVGCGGDAAAALLLDRVLDETESPALRARLIARWPAVCRGRGLKDLAAALPLMADPEVQQHLNCLLWEYY